MSEYSEEQIYTAIRAADAAGDGEAVKALLATLQTDDGLTGVVTDVQPMFTEAQAPAAPQPTGASSYGEALAAGVGDIAQGFGGLLGIVGNPVNATINAVAGTNLSTDLGQTARMGLPVGNETIGAINQGATAALTGGLAARGATALASPGVTQNVLGILGKTPVRDMMAGAGAAAGGKAGEVSGVPGGELFGTLVGGIGGYGTASGINKVARFANSGTPNALGQASARQGVDLLPADAGGSATKVLTSGAKASPLSSGPIRSAAVRNQEQMRTAAGRAVPAEPATTDVAGEGVRKAAINYRDKTSQRGERLYTKAYQLAEGVDTIQPAKTIAALDDQIARLEGNPATPESTLNSLRRFRAKIEGGVGIQGLRDARTLLSDSVYDGAMRSNSEKTMWKGVLGSIGDDIDAGLRTAGRDDAANVFKQADKFWQGRVKHIDEVLQPIIGKEGQKGGEQVIDAIESMARGKLGGNARLSRLLSEMPPEDANKVRATLVDRIGKATPGQQDATGEVFSSSTFLTNWNKLTPQAKTSLFGSGKMRQDLNDLALLAQEMKASQSMANHSNTAMAVAGGGNAIGAVAVGAAINPAVAAIIGGGQYVTGKLLASPGFARLLTRTAKLPEGQAARKLSEQLGVLAGREPLIAADAKALQQHLQQSFQQSPGRLAAEEENNAGPKPPQ